MRRPTLPTRPALLLLALAAVVLLGGCAALQRLFEGAFQRPTLTFRRADLQNVTMGSAAMNLVWNLENPNRLGLSLAEVDYTFFVEDKQVVAGRPRGGLQIPANGARELVFPAEFKFQELAPALQAFLTRDVANWRAEGSIGVDTPIGILRLPLRRSGQFEVPKIPQVSLATPRITELTLAGARLELPFTVKNRNSYPLPFGGLSGALDIAGARVGNISSGQLGLLEGGRTGNLTVPPTVNFASAGVAVANALRQGSGQVALSGQLQSGEFRVPVQFSQRVNFTR
jgi:LEA14-like dessication related protein